ncbi:hypothetical protein H7X87_01295 [Acetobacteraceae bacterium]|nr:hypothetical protein [Candidatus Parcubacteria bacterium]
MKSLLSMRHITKLQPTLLLYSFALAIIVLGAALLSSTEPRLQAQTAASNAGVFSGYAWSDNIGWIDFNPVNGSGVYVSPTDGITLGGYAWSDNIGWISFNENSGCPSGLGQCRPYLQGSKPGSIRLYGWAYAVSASDGWDGWISLRGNDTNAAASVSGSTLTFNGYAWGSEVVGWVQYSGSPNSNPLKVALTQCNDGIDNNSNSLVDTADTAVCTARSDTSEGGITPTIGTFNCVAPSNNPPLTSGQSCMLTWSGVVNGSSASIDQGIGSVTPVSGGSITTGALAATKTYRFTVTSSTGGIAFRDATVTVNPAGGPVPTGAFSATSPVRKGGSTTLSWSGIQNASSCTISANPSAGLGGDYTTSISSPATAGSRTASNLQTSPTIFTLMCVPSGGGAAQATGQPATVIVTPIPRYQEI